VGFKWLSFEARDTIGNDGTHLPSLLPPLPPSDAGTFGSGGYGAKASEKLMTVRGKDFRHEKTKKKRGNYRGGAISLASHSIKYDYGSDE